MFVRIYDSKNQGRGDCYLACDDCGEATVWLEEDEEAWVLLTGDASDLCHECAARKGQPIDDRFYIAKPEEVITFREDVSFMAIEKETIGYLTIDVTVEQVKYISVRVKDELPF